MTQAPVTQAPVTQQVVVEPTPPHATVDQSAPEELQDAPDDTAWLFEPGPGTDQSRRRWWSHPRVKLVVLGLAAVAAVLLIIWGIRFATKNPGSGDASTTTVTRPSHSLAPQDNHAASSTHSVPITAAQLTRYELWATALQKANETATKGFIAAGSTPTPAQITAVVTPFYTAVHLYDFQLHFIAWPASMQTAIEVDHAQMNALMSFLQSLSFESPTGMSAWLSQLHNRSGSVQTADNQIRQDLGLPSSSSFP